MNRSKRQLKALASLNLDLFDQERLENPAPATLYTRIEEEAGQVPVAIATTIDEVRTPAKIGLPTTEELYRMFDRYNWMYFDGKLPKVSIEYSNRMTTAGSCIPRRRQIRIGRKYHEIFPEEVGDTLKHEMIHLIHLNHGAAFKAEAARVGASIKAKSHPKLQKPPKYIYVCPGCGTEYPRQKIIRMASCGSCSRGGRFDERFKLKLKN